MDRLDVERLGGLAGFGGPGGHLKSKGTVDLRLLSKSDQDQVRALFGNPPSAVSVAPDAFWYRLTLYAPGGPKTIDVEEQQVPASICASVKDILD